jgi:hypothetical protein
VLRLITAMLGFLSQGMPRDMGISLINISRVVQTWYLVFGEIIQM